MSTWTPFLAWEGISGGVDKNGIATLMAGYYVPTLAEALTWVPADLRRLTSLPITRRSFNQEWGNGRLVDTGKDGAYKVSFTLEGMENPKDGENGAQFNADGATSEDDAESHPDLPFLLEKYEGSIEDNKLVFAPTISIDGGGDDVKNELFGFKKYYVAGLTWTKTHATLRPRTTVTTMLGKIDTPPKANDGYLPDLPGRRNWLKVVGKPSWRGNVWKVTESWLMSADGGWNEDVYR